MALNETRHHEAWEANCERVEAQYAEQARAEGCDLQEHPTLYPLMGQGLKETSYLLNAAADDDEFLEALNQRSEVCRLYLENYRRRIA